MSESASPESGPLSVEQAVAALMPEPVEPSAPEAPVEAAEELAEPQGETSAPEEAEGEAEQPAEVEATETEPEPVVAADPPKYWSQDAKAKFAELSPELQAVVLAQEGPREEAAAKAKADAETVRKAADAELGKVQQLAEQLGDFLPKAIEVFQSKWGDAPDWVAYAQEFGAAAMTIAKAQHEQDFALLQRTAEATAQAQAQAREQYVRTEFATLAEIAPELADPTKGAERRTEVTKYLVADGIAPQAIKDISAREMRIAHKAMLWDRAQAAGKARPPAPAAPVSTAPVRPAAGAAQSPQRSAVQQAQARFNLNPSAENAAALLLAKG